MNADFAKELSELLESVSEGPGELSPAMRQATMSYATMVGLNQQPAQDELPDALVPYVQKVTRNAYKVVDSDIDHLKELGYNEDELYELTISTALGAAMARYESGMALLDGR